MDARAAWSAASTDRALLSAALRHDCELWQFSHVQSIFGGTTEIQKEIIARRLGLLAILGGLIL